MRCHCLLLSEGHKSKLLDTCLGPWICAEFDGVVERCSKKFLIAKTLLLMHFNRLVRFLALERQTFMLEWTVGKGDPRSEEDD